MMEVLVFKTNIETLPKLSHVKKVFNDSFGELNWSVDMEDIDNVLRIETKGLFQETDIISLVKGQGLYCEELMD